MTRKKIESSDLKPLSLALVAATILMLAIFYNHSGTVAAQDPKISLDAPVSFPVDI